jgi:TorA maturation chaperone TorD
MTPDPEIDEEQTWRADTYSLLANLLKAPPSQDLLERLRYIPVDEAEALRQPIARAWMRLSESARENEPAAIAREYHALFIGMTRGEILPYASWYLTGFLMEKPLADLRSDLAAIGIQRHENVREPEDHIAALFEVMTLLIRRSDPRQADFFNRHIANWAQNLCRDLRKAPHAAFYRPVAHLAREFLTLEQNLLSLTD